MSMNLENAVNAPSTKPINPAIKTAGAVTRLVNIPGQKFVGTVKDNLIEGVFEIEHKKYDGTDAPPFPADFSTIDSLDKYLEADAFCESEDSILIKKAEETTEGAKDSWEAATQLSKWVAENINYAIPGGGTARKTYDIRAGECGAHSFLFAAFCRAVGIPARVVWGCMYVPNFGGSFGQHGWSEIYMGKVGWVPVDDTVFENDFVDSGYIRLGVLNSPTISLNAKKMEILDHKIGTGEKENADLSDPDKYSEYLAKYTNPQINTVVNVFIQNNNLTVDIPNKATLPFIDPDEDGRWFDEYNKNTLFFKFDENKNVIEMNIDSNTRFRCGEPVEFIIERIIEESGIEKGVIKYAELKESLPDEYFFSEKSFNDLGYRLLNKNNFIEAISIFKLNTKAYPDSWNVYDSLGEAFMKKEIRNWLSKIIANQLK